MKQIYWRFLVFLSCLPGVLTSQSCYQTLLQEGNRLLDNGQYAAAISQYMTAWNTCDDLPRDHRLQEKIKEAQEAQLRSLRVVIQEKTVLYEQAEKARTKAEQAEKQEKQARQLAQQKEALALVEGRRAESLRLALLSENLRAQGQLADALKLAYLAVRIAPEDSAAIMVRAFGEAVRDYYHKPVFAPDRAIQQAVLLPSGDRLLAQTADRALFLIDTATGSEYQALIQPGADKLHVVVSNAGAFFLTWADNRPLQLWNKNGIILATLTGHNEPVRFAAFSPDGKLILTGARDNTARLWNLDGTQAAVLTGHTGNVYGGGFCVQSQRLFTRSSDGTVRLWSQQGTLVAVLNRTGIYTYDVRLSPSGQFLLTGSADGFARIYDLDGQLVKEWHAGSSAVREVHFLNGDEVAAIRTGGREVYLWNWKTATVVAVSHPAAVEGFSFGDPAQKLASWTRDSMYIWGLDARLLARCAAHRNRVLGAVLVPDDDLVLSCSKDGTAKLWNLKGEIRLQWAISSETALPAALCPDNKTIMVVNADNTVSLTPMPDAVLAIMQPGMQAKTVEMEDFLKKYQVRFAGE